MRSAWALLLLGMILSGCASPGAPAAEPSPTSSAADVVPTTNVSTLSPPIQDEPACPEEALSKESWESAEAYFENLRGKEISMRLAGTIEGEVDTIHLAFSPAAEALRVTSSAADTDVRFRGSEYSLETAEGVVNGRDYRPGGAFATTYDEILAEFEDDSGASFLDDLAWGDYTAVCKTLAGVDVIEFTYEDGEYEDSFVVERAASHRLLSARSIDPALKDNYRISISYDPVEVVVDTNGSRVPLTLAFDVVDAYANARNGPYVSGVFNDDTEWAPLAEMYFDLVDSEGNVYVHTQMSDGSFDLEDDDLFEFHDRDENRLLSPGDTFVMDLGPDLDILFWDEWAKAYTVSPTD